MELHKPSDQNRDAMVGNHAAPAEDVFEAHHESQDDMLATAATVTMVGAGVLIFEAALLPGLVLGIATMLIPKHLPKLGAAVTPLMKSTVRGAYTLGEKTKEMFAEVSLRSLLRLCRRQTDPNKRYPGERMRSPMMGPSK